MRKTSQRRQLPDFNAQPKQTIGDKLWVGFRRAIQPSIQEFHELKTDQLLKAVYYGWRQQVDPWTKTMDRQFQALWPDSYWGHEACQRRLTIAIYYIGWLQQNRPRTWSCLPTSSRLCINSLYTWLRLQSEKDTGPIQRQLFVRPAFIPLQVRKGLSGWLLSQQNPRVSPQ